MNDHSPYLPLFTQITPDTTVLTPNRRLSAHLLKQYHLHLTLQQKSCWHTPDILPMNSWIERLWQAYTFSQEAAPLLLSEAQETLLWEKIIETTPESKHLLRISETVAAAIAAWELVKAWQIDTAHPEFQHSENTLTWRKWAIQFAKLLQQKKCLDMASSVDELANAISAKKLSHPKTILLVGFNEISPQHQFLLNTCQQSGTKVHTFSTATKNAICHQVALETSEEEIRTMARWARSRLEIQAEKPLTIACIIPSLDQNRDRIMQIFSDVFSDKKTFPVLPFNISAGKSLLHYPLIQAAFDLLSLHDRNLSIETVSQLLRSPFVGDAEQENFQRAKWGSLLRQANKNSITLAAIPFDLTTHCPLLAKRLKDFFLLYQNKPHSNTYSEWASFFAKLLTALGWPGERSLNSPEYQTFQNWLMLFSEYKALDFVSGKSKYKEALHTFEQINSKHIFQPQSPETPIQLLGVLEGAGLPFDAIWIAGMDDLAWPPQPKPNPFIPKKIQRALCMPHATAQRESEYCQQLLAQFQENTNQLICSYAKNNEDIALEASPLIRDFTEISVDNLNCHPYLSRGEKIFQSKKIEWIMDDKGPALKEGEKIRGGVSIIKHEAACPFKAFAEWRLYAKPLEIPEFGLQAKERGILVHKALEIFWNKVISQENLNAFAPSALALEVHACASAALQYLYPTTFKKTRYLQLEMQRIEKLLLNWLAVEKNRPPFTVMCTEKNIALTLAPSKLTLNIKVDRIDQLPNGKYLVIDYKTGKDVSIQECFGEKPNEPQLPLYCLSDPQHIIGISFARIHTEKVRFHGVGDTSLTLEKLKTLDEMNDTEAKNWQEQIDLWNKQLTQLAMDYAEGKAWVAPKEKKTCNQCHLQPLCRIHEEGAKIECE